MNEVAAQVLKALADVKALRKLKKDVDPASGMTVSVRRGVARDNEDTDNDAERRPWHTMELSGGADKCAAIHGIIDTLITQRLEALSYWTGRCEHEANEIGDAVEASDLFLAAENK